MSNSKLFKSYLREGLLFLCGLLILIASVTISTGRISVLSQDQRKSISTGTVIRNLENDPVKIKSIKVGTATRRFTEEFEESDDWLKRLSLEIENHWTKPIVYLLVSLDFPETRSSGNEMRFYVHSGNEPSRPAKRENIYVAPGDKIIINMAERYDWLTEFLQTRHPMSQIHRVEIKITRAVFDDKTAWGEGDFFVPDPYKPGRYNNVGTNPPKP